MLHASLDLQFSLADLVEVIRSDALARLDSHGQLPTLVEAIQAII